MTRRICVVTGSRADYGHLQPVMKAIAADPGLTLQVIACGQHLDPRFGETWRAIVADGFAIDAKVDQELANDSALAVAQATGRGVARIAAALSELRPDIVLVLGDRYEILAAGIAALLLTIPLAHLHGGEATEAAIDDAIRHALSKMAALHFVAAEPYRRRLVQMGENPARVILTGAPGLDHLDTMTFLSRDELAADLGIALTPPVFLVTYHPVTLQTDHGTGGMAALIAALARYPAATIVFTGVNSDPGHAALQESVRHFVAAGPHRVYVASLGQRRYLSAMKIADAVIGNSSSGLIEAPALGVPTVNIGERQKGRLRSASVIDCGEEDAAVAAGIARALDPAFRASLARMTPAYVHGGAAAKIVAALKAAPCAELSTKHFHDIIAPPGDSSP
jgi:UDP-hydrolysing UDP-N-acetyl-D-glucosamine 2-epimerase